MHHAKAIRQEQQNSYHKSFLLYVEYEDEYENICLFWGVLFGGLGDNYLRPLLVRVTAGLNITGSFQTYQIKFISVHYNPIWLLHYGARGKILYFIRKRVKKIVQSF